MAPVSIRIALVHLGYWDRPSALLCEREQVLYQPQRISRSTQFVHAYFVLSGCSFWDVQDGVAQLESRVRFAWKLLCSHRLTLVPQVKREEFGPTIRSPPMYLTSEYLLLATVVHSDNPPIYKSSKQRWTCRCQMFLQQHPPKYETKYLNHQRYESQPNVAMRMLQVGSPMGRV